MWGQVQAPNTLANIFQSCVYTSIMRWSGKKTVYIDNIERCRSTNNSTAKDKQIHSKNEPKVWRVFNAAFGERATIYQLVNKTILICIETLGKMSAITVSSTCKTWNGKKIKWDCCSFFRFCFLVDWSLQNRRSDNDARAWEKNVQFNKIRLKWIRLKERKNKQMMPVMKIETIAMPQQHDEESQEGGNLYFNGISINIWYNMAISEKFPFFVR